MYKKIFVLSAFLMAFVGCKPNDTAAFVPSYEDMASRDANPTTFIDYRKAIDGSCLPLGAFIAAKKEGIWLNYRQKTGVDSLFLYKNGVCFDSFPIEILKNEQKCREHNIVFLLDSLNNNNDLLVGYAENGQKKGMFISQNLLFQQKKYTTYNVHHYLNNQQMVETLTLRRQSSKQCLLKQKTCMKTHSPHKICIQYDEEGFIEEWENFENGQVKDSVFHFYRKMLRQIDVWNAKRGIQETVYEWKHTPIPANQFYNNLSNIDFKKYIGKHYYVFFPNAHPVLMYGYGDDCNRGLRIAHEEKANCMVTYRWAFDADESLRNRIFLYVSVYSPQYFAANEAIFPSKCYECQQKEGIIKNIELKRVVL